MPRLGRGSAPGEIRGHPLHHPPHAAKHPTPSPRPLPHQPVAAAGIAQPPPPPRAFRTELARRLDHELRQLGGGGAEEADRAAGAAAVAGPAHVLPSHVVIVTSRPMSTAGEDWVMRPTEM